MWAKTTILFHLHSLMRVLIFFFFLNDITELQTPKESFEVKSKSETALEERE